MQRIEGILFEPVGCLAEFPSEPFHEIAARVFGVPKKKPSRSGSRAYWHLLNLMETSGKNSIESLEMEAVGSTTLYEDVVPALAELKAMGIRLSIASSLSRRPLARFLDKHNLYGRFSSVWNRDNSGGIKAVPLQHASRDPESEIYLTDTAEGLKVAKSVGLNAVLMMNDPDEARRLAQHNPAGGVVSLHELPDFVRVIRSCESRKA